MPNFSSSEILTVRPAVTGVFDDDHVSASIASVRAPNGEIGLTWKFLWSPLMDRYALPWLGRRRSWMAVSHVALVACIVWLGSLSPKESLGTIVIVTVCVALLSATLDIALDAFRRELLDDIELGIGNAVINVLI